MKSLLMIRHAQTEMMAKSDMARQLTEQGTTDALALGQMLYKGGFSADIIVSSPAVRAQRTSQLIACGIGYNENSIVTEKLLYHAHAEEIVSFIRNFDNKVEYLIVVGHNPIMLEAINMLGTKRLSHLIAGHAVQFQFDTDLWKDIGTKNCKLFKHLSTIS